MTKISIQFSQLHCESCFLSPPLSLSPGLSSYFNFILSVSRSPIPCCYRPLKHSVTDFHLLFFLFFFSASAYKPETLLPLLPRCGKWRESGKGVITMSIHKHSTPRDCMDESTNATGKLPTQPGTSHLLHSGAPQQTSAYTHAK